MESEVWKVYRVTHRNNQYYSAGVWEVSNQGNVRHNGVQIDLSKYEHRCYIGISGFYVHRAVAELFVPNPENKPAIDHINTNKHDNRAVNLRWVTIKENNNNPLTIQHNKESHKGQIAWNKGKTGCYSDEALKNMSIGQKNRAPDSEETRRKKSISAQNRAPDSEETRKKKSKNAKGNKNAQDHKWMNNGTDEVLPHISDVDKWLKKGYIFGRL